MSLLDVLLWGSQVNQFCPCGLDLQSPFHAEFLNINGHPIIKRGKKFIEASEWCAGRLASCGSITFPSFPQPPCLCLWIPRVWPHPLSPVAFIKNLIFMLPFLSDAVFQKDRIYIPSPPSSQHRLLKIVSVARLQKGPSTLSPVQCIQHNPNQQICPRSFRGWTHHSQMLSQIKYV